MLIVSCKFCFVGFIDVALVHRGSPEFGAGSCGSPAFGVDPPL